LHISTESRKRQRITINQPTIVKVYNNTMGGVDRADQNVSAYRITMRTKKWWWPLFAYVLDLVIQNGWLLYHKTPSWQQRQLNLQTFRRDLVCVYLMCHAQPARMGCPGQPVSESACSTTGSPGQSWPLLYRQPNSTPMCQMWNEH